MKLTLQILDSENGVRAEKTGIDEAVLVHDLTYEPGDRLCFAVEQPGRHLVFSLDQGLCASLAYVAGNRFEFRVPFGRDRDPYPPQSFLAQRHRLFVRAARPDEIHSRRNLALNPWDHHANESLFPHSFANVETRGEAVFAARNTIDGEMANDDHGIWPYTSWGINRDPEAALTLQFGRLVAINEVVIRTRADFPHDAWWERATLIFSHGPDLSFELRKTGINQTFSFPERTVEWVRLEQLIKADDPSPFPALTQIEFWGREVG